MSQDSSVRGWLTGILTVAAVAAACFGAPPASAHFSAGDYSHNPSANCNLSTATRIDPVSVIFYGNATGANVDAHLATHTGWPSSSSSAQHFVSHAACGAQSHERRSGSFGVGGAYSWHIRLRKTYDADATLGTTSQSTPHKDLTLGCGHVAASFNDARDEVVSRMGASGHHPYYWQNWGNTQLMTQCDGRQVQSSGIVGFVSVP